MAHRKTLTASQVELLRWIADGCPAGIMTGTGYRVSAAALRSRGLVTTRGHGPGWSANITAKGEEYLTSLDGPGAPPPRQANVSVTEQLIDDLLAAGGTLCLPANRWSRTGVWKQQNRRYLHYGTPALQVRYPPRPEYETPATGRLRVELPKLYRTSRTGTWADRRRWTLEDKLPEVLRELEVRVAEHVHEQLEREREAAARQIARETALEQARERHATHQRARVLLDEVERWETAERIRSYCDTATARHPNEPATAIWIAWALQHAADLDPLTDPPSSPPDPENVPERDLQAFLAPGVRRPDRF